MATDIVYEVAHPDSLTMAELDEVLELTGIDVAAARGDASMAGRVMAALVVWTRRQAGEVLDFDQVYRTLRGSQLRVSRVDPTPPAES